MLFREAEGHIEGSDKREPPMNPAHSETPGMLGNSMRENRETPLVSGRKRPEHSWQVHHSDNEIEYDLEEAPNDRSMACFAWFCDFAIGERRFGAG